MLPKRIPFRPNAATLALVSSAFVLGLGISSSVSAASLSATVTDESDGQPLESASLDLYLWDPTNQWWQYYGNQWSDADGGVAFSDLPAGTYYARPYASHDLCYISEYYDDAREWSDRTEFTLADTDDQTLNPIELEPRPVCFEDLTIDPSSLPSEGGNVTLSGTVVNNTSLTPEVTYWVNMYTYNQQFEAHSEFTLVGPGRFTLPAGQTPFAFDVQVPADAPVDEWFGFQIHVGLSPWLPAAYGYFGSVWKYPEGAAASTSPPRSISLPSLPQSKGIPHRISADGTVLGWR